MLLTHRKMPNATQSCQLMTKLPRKKAGEFSAANTGTVDALLPIPIPSRQRQKKSWTQFFVNAAPITEAKQNTAEKNIVPLRPV